MRPFFVVLIGLLIATAGVVRADVPASGQIVSCMYWPGSTNPFVFSTSLFPVPVQCNASGRLIVDVSGSTATPAFFRVQDGVGTATAGVIGTSTNINPTGLATHSMAYGYNGGGFDPERARLGELQITSGGNTRTKATSTVCVSASTGAQTLHRIWAAGVETATLAIYDEGASPTCAAADLVYNKVPPNGSPDVLDAPMSSGIAYKLSAAAAMNDYITSN